MLRAHHCAKIDMKVNEEKKAEGGVEPVTSQPHLETTSCTTCSIVQPDLTFLCFLLVMYNTFDPESSILAETRHFESFSPRSTMKDDA